MPHVLLIVVAGAGLYAGFKWAQRTAARVDAFKSVMQSEAERARREAEGPRDLGTLEFDTSQKVYRPKPRA